MGGVTGTWKPAKKKNTQTQQSSSSDNFLNQQPKAAAPPQPEAQPENKPVNVKLSGGKRGQPKSYEVTKDGVKQTLSQQQWDELLDVKKGGSSRDKNILAAYEMEKRSAMEQRLNNPKYKAQMEMQQMIEAKKKELATNQYTGQPISIELPTVEPDQVNSGILSGALTKGAEYGLKAAAGTAIPAALVSGTGVGAPAAAAGVGIAAAGGFAYGAIKGGFSAAKESKSKILSSAGSLTSDAERGIKNTINLAGQGLPEGEARERFEQDVAYLSRARENLKALDKKDHAFFEREGQDEQRDVEEAIANLEVYRAQLYFALANQDINKADMYNLSLEE